jgi:hypothetical protein
VLLLLIVGLSLLRLGLPGPRRLQAVLDGAGEYVVINTCDAELHVTITQLSDEQNDPSMQDAISLAPLEIGGQGGLPAGRYRLDFSGAELPAPLTCEFRLQRKDSYHFVVVPEGIVVTRQDSRQESAIELDVRSSPLCQQ